MGALKKGGCIDLMKIRMENGDCRCKPILDTVYIGPVTEGRQIFLSLTNPRRKFNENIKNIINRWLYSGCGRILGFHVELIDYKLSATLADAIKS